MFFSRMFQIIRIALPLIFKKAAGPVKLRLFFERAGGAFIKLGQILALRRDFLSLRCADELMALSDKVPAAPFEEMKNVFARETGRTTESFFSEFDPTPVASSSISQLYKARLKNGDLVAVKIQRPNARPLFEADFKIAAFFAALADFLKLFPGFCAREAASEFIAWSRRKLDFTVEAKNADIIYKHSRAHPMTVVPKQYLELTASRVLIQEFIAGGVSAEEFYLHQAGASALAQKNIDPRLLANYFIFDIMRQCFIDGFFHADPHPANLIFLPGNKLVYLDFGIVGESNGGRFDCLKIICGLARKDVSFVAENMVACGQKIMNEELLKYLRKDPKTRKNFDSIFIKLNELIAGDLKMDLEKFLLPWFESTGDPKRAFSEKSGAEIFFSLVKTGEKYGIHFPKEIVLFFRAMGAIDTIALRISPDFDMIKALSSFFEEYSLGEAEEIIKQEAHKGIEKSELVSVGRGHGESWEEFKKMAAAEREKIRMARERAMNLLLSYAEKYKDIRAMIKEL